ncbi:leucine rich repeat protein [Thraustotheca clavata]|uniref:Leucine rich repeat protein n=1 Tax=Thraustotheca clavata TaxID=74557 RepID=A0A1W0A147_9STRA|nr:leucine rich repeat protein [Thraustotheca clavata]
MEKSKSLVQNKLEKLLLDCRSIQRAIVKGTSLMNKPDIVKSVFQTFECLEYLQITPVLSSPPDVFNCKTLLELDLSDIGLHQIPVSMATLPLLKTLRASNNRLNKSSFPTEVELWPLIETIDFSSNHFSVLPEIFEQWKCLLYCDLSKNQLLTLNEQVVGQWKALRTLSLHNNRLVSLPESIQQCQKLSSLSCQYNSLVTLPHGISQLHELQKLTFDHNKLAWTTIPSLKGLNCLAQCTLAHNQIKSIPMELHYESLKALRVCSLGHNLLRDISNVEWTYLVACTEVDLRQNRLVKLPTSLFQMPQLQHLNVESNALTYLPAEIECAKQLISLDVHRNQISMLPDELAKISTMNQLDLSQNRIASIPLAWRDFLLHRHSNKNIVMEMLKLDALDNPLVSPLKEIVAKGCYKSPAAQQLTLTLIKLIDYLQKSTTKRSKVELITFQSLHKNDKKQYDLKVRKGQAKLATEYLDWAFRDICRVSANGVDVQSFRRILNALGCPWTKIEWTRIMTEFEGSSSLTINLESFLNAIEHAHQSSSTNLAFVEQLLNYLQDTSDTMELKPSKQQPKPPPFTPPTSQTKTSVQATITKETPCKPKPTKNEMRLREQVRRQRERMEILQQQLQDKLNIQQSCEVAEESNNRRYLEIFCMGATTLGTLKVSWQPKWTVMDLKQFIEHEYQIPQLQQVKSLFYACADKSSDIYRNMEKRKRLDNADRLRSTVHAIYTPRTS